MIKAIIFDMDGTLLDSMHVWDHVGESYLSSLGIHAQKGLQEILTPMSLVESSKYLKEEYHIEKSIEQIQQGIEQVVLHHYQEDIMLKDGVKECIENCVNKQYRLCVLTASSIDMARSALKRCGILHHFEYIMTCEEANCPKTDKRIYQKMLDKLKLKKEECLFIDDALYAISCMKQEGYQVYAVYDEANAADWDKICEMSDQTFLTFADWKGIV